MSCSRYNINLTVGESHIIYLNVNNSDGSYINLSGFSCRGKVRANYSDTGYLYDLNPQVAIWSGIIMISGGASSTTGLIPGQFNYDVEIYNSGDYALKVLNGDFSVYPSTSF